MLLEARAYLRPRLDGMRLAAAVWTVALLAISLRTAVAPALHSVFPIYAEAAEHWRMGEDLYQATGEPFRYSPLIAVFFVPFALLPPWLGGLAWRAIGVAVYLIALAGFSRHVLPAPWTNRQRALWWLLLLPLSLGSLNNGQSNVLVLGLILLSLVAVQGERWNLASCALGFACLCKVYPIAVALLLVLCRPRRLAARLAIVLGIGILLPFLFQHPNYVVEQYRQWSMHLQMNDRHLLAPHLWYRDLRLVASALDVDIGYQAYQIVQLFAGAGLAACCLALLRVGCPERWLLTLLLGLGCCWMTILGSATESCTYTLLAPTAAWLVLLKAGSTLRGRWLGWLGFALLCLAPLLASPGSGKQLWLRALQPLAGLLLFLDLLCLAAGQVVRRAEGRSLCPDCP